VASEPYTYNLDGQIVNLPIQAIVALASCVHRFHTGQLTFHFTQGTLRQIQRNAFETVK
jgi:hypothetical protein